MAEIKVETRQRTPVTQPASYTSTGAKLQLNENRLGALELEIVTVQLLDRANLPIAELNSGDSLPVKIEYLASQPIDAPIFGVTITGEKGQICCDIVLQRWG